MGAQDNMGHSEFEEPLISYLLQDHHIRAFRSRGFLRLANVITPRAVLSIEKRVTSVVHSTLPLDSPAGEEDAYSRAFSRVMNIRLHDEKVNQLSFSRGLARIGARLLGVGGVRISHDQALYKLSRDGPTPIHADQYHWPVSNDNTLTAWIPFQDTPIEMGAVSFYEGSHLLDQAMREALSEKSQAELHEFFSKSAFPLREEPFLLGDVSFHYGWTFHRAAANNTQLDRKVYTIVYMDKDIRLVKPRNNVPLSAFDSWCPGCHVGDFLRSPLNPVVFFE